MQAQSAAVARVSRGARGGIRGVRSVFRGAPTIPVIIILVLIITAAFGDIFVNALPTKTDNCPSDAGYGMRFRLTDSENYYFFVVWCNDSYSVGGEQTGPTHYTYISRTDLPDSLSGNAESTHVIGLLAQGSNFTLYMDGIELATFEDENSIHSSGDVAMWALAPGAGVLRLIFDDLEVYDLDVQ